VSGFILRRPVVADLQRAYRWYESERSGLGEEFLLAVHRGIEKVIRLPEGHAVIHRDTRRALVPRFPYGLFYRIMGETVVFVACYHLRRRPASWKKRR